MSLMLDSDKKKYNWNLQENGIFLVEKNLKKKLCINSKVWLCLDSEAKQSRDKKQFDGSRFKWVQDKKTNVVYGSTCLSGK